MRQTLQIFMCGSSQFQKRCSHVWFLVADKEQMQCAVHATGMTVKSAEKSGQTNRRKGKRKRKRTLTSDQLLGFSPALPNSHAAFYSLCCSFARLLRLCWCKPKVSANSRHARAKFFHRQSCVKRDHEFRKGPNAQVITEPMPHTYIKVRCAKFNCLFLTNHLRFCSLKHCPKLGTGYVWSELSCCPHHVLLHGCVGLKTSFLALPMFTYLHITPSLSLSPIRERLELSILTVLFLLHCSLTLSLPHYLLFLFSILQSPHHLFTLSPSPPPPASSPSLAPLHSFPFSLSLPRET